MANTEKVMGMYSKELAEMDRNTVLFMIDRMQAEINEQKAEINEQKAEINEQKMEFAQAKQVIDEQAARIRELEAQLAGK